MNKFLSIFLVFVILLVFSGCQKTQEMTSNNLPIIEEKENDSKDTQSKTEIIIEDTITPPLTIPDDEIMKGQEIIKEEVILPSNTNNVLSSNNTNTEEQKIEKECKHLQLQFVPSDNPPTCGKAGYYLKWCPDCLIEIKVHYEAFGHNYEYLKYPNNAKAATCISEGYEGEIAKCKNNCGSWLKGKILPKNDNHQNIKSIPETYVESTCSKEGQYANLKCFDCGYIKQGEVIKKKEHILLPATCIQPSICKNCGIKQGDVNKNNHTGETGIKGIIEQIAPCCSGYTGDTYCLSCNTKVKNGQKIRPTLTHTWSTKYLSNPYSVQNTCARCQSVETTILSPLNIVYVGKVDGKLYFEPVNNYTGTGRGYTKLTYEYVTSSGGKVWNSSGATCVPLYGESTVIITITISEYTNNINQKSAFRKVTKYFDTATSSWIN